MGVDVRHVFEHTAKKYCGLSWRQHIGEMLGVGNEAARHKYRNDFEGARKAESLSEAEKKQIKMDIVNKKYLTARGSHGIDWSKYGSIYNVSPTELKRAYYKRLF
jgi:hypothetical protein